MGSQQFIKFIWKWWRSSPFEVTNRINSCLDIRGESYGARISVKNGRLLFLKPTVITTTIYVKRYEIHSKILVSWSKRITYFTYFQEASKRTIKTNLLKEKTSDVLRKAMIDRLKRHLKQSTDSVVKKSRLVGHRASPAERILQRVTLITSATIRFVKP